MVSDVRILMPEDTPALRTFLSDHWATSVFLQSNVHQTPIGNRGRFAGRYVAKFEDERITDVAAYYTTFGTIVMQAPTNIAAVVAACIPPGQPLNGLLGPLDQVEQAARILSVQDRKALLEKPETLYALDLAELKRPSAFDAGDLRCRAASNDDIETLIKWRASYSVEALFAKNDDSLLDRVGKDITHEISAGDVFVLESTNNDASLLAMASYNAKTPDIVQIGGVWTPRDLRSKGYGRAVTAGALDFARRVGVGKAVLFTPVSNLAAQRAYESIGFEKIGHYGVRLYAL